MSTDVEPFRCQWLGSYFSGRIQRVKMGDCVSRDNLVTSGVPQESHLGPLCFIWFVNEIPRIFRHVQVLFYADDMKLFLPVRGFRDCLKTQIWLASMLPANIFLPTYTLRRNQSDLGSPTTQIMSIIIRNIIPIYHLKLANLPTYKSLWLLKKLNIDFP
jgi:hypothetical protein